MTQKNEHEEQESKFKVVDRRRFTDEGEARDEESEVEQAKQEAHFGSPTEEQNASDPSARGPITFAMFVQSLAHQSLMAMGLVPWPDNGLIEPRLDHARETIDILSLLHDKTKGNLTQQEQAMFDGLLYELRMTFVQVLQGNVGETPSPSPAQK